MPKAHLTCVATTYGRLRSVAGFGNDFGGWATEAGLQRRRAYRSACRLQVLKKDGMRRLAEVANMTHELLAVSRHCTLFSELIESIVK